MARRKIQPTTVTPDQVARFTALDTDSAESILEWAAWDDDKWGAETVRAIDDGEYDAALAQIVLACNKRMASVFKAPLDQKWHPGINRSGTMPADVQVSIVDGMKRASLLVDQHGLKEVAGQPWKKKVTRLTYGDIITEYGNLPVPPTAPTPLIVAPADKAPARKRKVAPKAPPSPAAKRKAPAKKTTKPASPPATK